MAVTAPEHDGQTARIDAPRRWPVLPLTLWVVSLGCALAIGPTLDDWGMSTPLRSFDWRHFRPGVFWRPFELFLRFASGAAPETFPAGVHLVVMVGHGLSAWLIYQLIRFFSRPSALAATLTAVFIVSPGVMMAAWSLDSANQTWSTACGLASLWCRLKAPDRALGLWLLWCVLAIFWKESGAAWFVVVPLCAEGLLCVTGRTEVVRLRRVLVAVTVGLAIVGLYFVVRSSLAFEGQIVARDGRYALNGSLLTTLKHVAMLVGAALSTVDTVAVIPELHRNLPLGVVTGGLGVPLLLLLVWHLRGQGRSPGFWLCALGVGAVTGPHIIFNRVSEMHVHPVLAICLVTLAVSVDWRGMPRRVALGCLGLWLVGALSATGHKYATWLETSASVDGITEALVPQWEGAPVTRVCGVGVPRIGWGYATFSADPFDAAGFGECMMAAWGWPDRFRHRLRPTREACLDGWPEAVVYEDEAGRPIIERVDPESLTVRDRRP